MAVPKVGKNQAIEVLEKVGVKIFQRIFSAHSTVTMANFSGREILTDAKPLFLIGVPRSGTTMLTRILNSHSRILLTNETAVLLQLADTIEKSRIGRKAGMIYGKNSGDIWADVLTESTRELLMRFYVKLALKGQKENLKYWGEKHPHFNRCIKFLAEQYPDATYVYLIRDPRDSSCSIAEMNDKPVEAGMQVCKRISESYERFVHEVSSKNHVITIIYEYFINNYVKEAEKLFEKLGLDFDDSSRKYVENYQNVDAHTSSSFVFKGAALLKKSSRTRNFSESSIDRWRRDMDAEQQKNANKLFGSFLKKYDYLLK